MGRRIFFTGLSLTTLAIAAIVACGDDEQNGPGAGNADAAADGRPAPTRTEFGLETRPANTTCKAPPRPPSTAAIKVERVYENAGTFAFPQFPMVAAQRPGDSSRWYIAQRTGELAYFDAVNPAGTTIALQLASGQPRSIASAPGLITAGEGGFLGFVFHPSFATNGKAYVSFTAPSTTGKSMSSVVAEITSSDGGNTFTGYKQLLRFEQNEATNHKGGGLALSKDGYLYAGFGDGGGSDDSYANGQKKTGYFAKIHRFAVDAAATPELYAMGFRNPFRISADRETGEIWAGDVGQNQWEEINLVKQGGNYGWPCREGTHPYVTTAAKCPSTVGLLPPVVEIQHTPNNNTRSITGGVVYRGKAIPEIAGSYIFGDYKKHDFFVLSKDHGTGEQKLTTIPEASSLSATWVNFAEDVDGEVYALSLEDSRMFKVVRAGAATGTPFPDRLSATGCKDTGGLVPYGVNAELWSDGAAKSRFIALPDAAKIAVGQNGDFDLPNGSVVVKTFALGGKPIETRLLVRHDDGGWAGYSYEWLDDGSDAVLLAGAKVKTVGSQQWFYPSRSDCPSCHTDVAGRTLGLELGQLNGDYVYDSTNRISNQLTTLEHIGLFDKPLGKPAAELTVYPQPGSSAPVESRARAYLHANCAHCHQPSGPGSGDWDLRFATSFAGTKICNANPEGDTLGVAGAKLFVPSDPTKSLLSLRPHASGANRMPPLATTLVDTAGLAVVDAWITSVTSCP